MLCYPLDGVASATGVANSVKQRMDVLYVRGKSDTCVA